MKNQLLVYFILFQTITCYSQRRFSIQYKFNFEVSEKIDSSFNVIKKITEKNKQSNFFIFFDRKGDSTIITISNISNGPVAEIINITERYFFAKTKIKIPIIFEYDIKYSSIFKSNQLTFFPSFGGYTIILNKKGTVIFEGFQQ